MGAASLLPQTGQQDGKGTLQKKDIGWQAQNNNSCLRKRMIYIM